MERVFEHLPRLVVKEEADRLLKNGNKIFTEMLYNEYNRDVPEMSQNMMYRVYNYKGRFCAVYEMTDEGLKIKYNFM